MKSSFWTEGIAAAKQGPRLYFAPLIGAICSVRDELQRSESICTMGLAKQRASSSRQRKRSK